MGYTQTEGGLLVPEAMDERAVSRLLRQYDPELRLVPPGVTLTGETREQVRSYRVARYAGSERPIQFVCGWWDERGEPLPLSSSLLDRVMELDRNTRAKYLDDVARNELARQERDKNAKRDYEAIQDNNTFKHGRPVLPRSQSLRMSRDKRRARGEKC